jgi:predicted enzyme related to lactoylglutathione lyase
MRERVVNSLRGTRKLPVKGAAAFGRDLLTLQDTRKAGVESSFDDFCSPGPSQQLNPRPNPATLGGSMTTTTTGIQAIGLVMVPTSDQDRSIEFYEKIGFEKRTDVPFGGGYRWVELYPPVGTTGIALAPPRQGEDVKGRELGISITTADIDTTFGEMSSQGVDVDEQVSRMGDPVPPMFWFRDPEGNSLMVVEQS